MKRRSSLSIKTIRDVRSVIHSVRLIRFGQEGFSRLRKMADRYCTDVPGYSLDCSYVFPDAAGNPVIWSFGETVAYTPADFLSDKRTVIKDLEGRIVKFRDRNRKAFLRKMEKESLMRSIPWLIPELDPEYRG